MLSRDVDRENTVVMESGMSGTPDMPASGMLHLQVTARLEYSQVASAMASSALLTSVTDERLERLK
jgi:hypothetical protein